MYIDHINICVSSDLLTKVKFFYCNLFKLKEGKRPDFKNKGIWLYFDNKPIIHLDIVKDIKTKKQNHFNHMAFRIENLDEIIHNLDYMKIPYESFYIQEINMRQLFFKDPTNLNIEVNYIDN